MTDEAKAAPEPKTPKRGIGTVIKEAILAGKTNEEALELAKAEFENGSTTLATVSWYRNKLRNDGHKVSTARELKTAAKKAAEGNAAAPKEADPLA